MIRDGRWPAVVVSVDRSAREVRVKIPGITDGDDLQPLAAMEYPLGDDSRYTEIRILAGDLVWVVFERGDERYPIITGYRCPRVGNETGWRRWRHDNFEVTADDVVRIVCKQAIVVAEESVSVTTKSVDVTTDTASITASESVEIMAATLAVTAESTFNGNVAITENLAVGGNAAVAGGLDVEGVSHARGNFSTDGSISAAKPVSAPDFVSNGVSLPGHHHNVNGNSTGNALP